MGKPDHFDTRQRETLRALEAQRAVARLYELDASLWPGDPDEIRSRLGWVHEAERLIQRAPDLRAEVEKLAEGIDEIVWCGMGGSSLFPELVTATTLPRAAARALHVLDSSHPAAVARIVESRGATNRLYVFASKSGSTIETRTQLETLWAVDPRARFAVVTDPGSELERFAQDHNWTALLANPDVGGRFSAFTTFGAAAAALVGIDLAALARPAVEMNDAVRADETGALALASFVAAACSVGRDKLTVVTPPAFSGFGAWVEQLVAESTGKRGFGILPVVDEPLGPIEVYGDDRCFVTYGELAGVAALREAGHPVFDLGPAVIGRLGAELQRWMLATAWIGVVLGIDPFDQPDVEQAKRRAVAALEQDDATGPIVSDPATVLASLERGDHIVVQAFVDPAGPIPAQLEALRLRLRAKFRCAVTVGIGPRYLHSTGQLHKGGPNTGVFLQVVDAGDIDVEIPGRGHGFARLLRAQADGDHAALVAARRRVVRASLDDVLASA